MAGTSGRTRTTLIGDGSADRCAGRVSWPASRTRRRDDGRGSDAEGRLDVGGAARVLPREALAAEVAVRGRLGEDRLAEVEVSEDRSRAEIEDVLDRERELRGVD